MLAVNSMVWGSDQSDAPKGGLEGGDLLRRQAPVIQRQHLLRGPLEGLVLGTIAIGEVDAAQAVVGAVAAPLHLAGGLQALEHEGQGGLVQAGAGGQLGLGEAGLPPQGVDDPALGRVEVLDAMTQEDPAETAAGQLMDLGQQDAAVSWGRDEGRLGVILHARSAADNSVT